MAIRKRKRTRKARKNPTPKARVKYRTRTVTKYKTRKARANPAPMRKRRKYRRNPSELGSLKSVIIGAGSAVGLRLITNKLPESIKGFANFIQLGVAGYLLMGVKGKNAHTAQIAGLGIGIASLADLMNKFIAVKMPSLAGDEVLLGLSEAEAELLGYNTDELYLAGNAELLGNPSLLGEEDILEGEEDEELLGSDFSEWM